jgi:hypothetical protein
MLLRDAEDSVPEIDHTTGWLQCFEARKVVYNFDQIGDEHKSAASCLLRQSRHDLLQLQQQPVSVCRQPQVNDAAACGQGSKCLHAKS